MIKIDKIYIHKFRGIIELELNFNKENFTVCGPNGTGKSGVIDAIEFVLSGDISRLTGSGTGDVSIKKHAPHVDYRDKPNEAYVSLNGTIRSTGENFQISRSVGNIQSTTIEPNSDTIIDTLRQLSARKNISLSRRELIQYIISKKSDRAEQINALLQLNQLTSLLKTFQKITRKENSLQNSAESEKKMAAEQLARALQIPSLNSKALLTEVNKQRKILALSELLKLEKTTSLVDGLATVSSDSAKKTINKKTAESDTLTLKQKIEDFLSQDIQLLIHQAIEAVSELSNNQVAWKEISKLNLFNEALKHLDEDKCPVCDTKWEVAHLTQLVQTKITNLQFVTTEKSKISSNIAPALTTIKNIIHTSKLILPYGEFVEPKQETDIFKTNAEKLEKHCKTIEAFSSAKSIEDALNSLTDCIKSLVTPCTELLERIQNLEEKPDPLTARDFLTVANERLEQWRNKDREVQKSKQKTTLAESVFETYKNTYEKTLNDVYFDVQEEFAKFYSFINDDDESGFTATLEVSKSALDLNVDFYGKGNFPPGAYHSEGHQDGMGLCLYLALMKHLYADEFQICVLDDVLMSVDSSHRRKVCDLIKTEFPNTQFIFTTHDDVWLKNMQSSGIIESKNYIRFRKWDVDTGPHEWNGRDVWNEITEKVENNEINSAAHTLRYYLEFYFGEICNNLGAQVVYRGDNRHTLGDLLPQGYSKLKKTLEEAEKVALHWEKNDEASAIATFRKKLITAYSEANVENWAVNSSVHYNEGTNLQKTDFTPVADSFKKICSFFYCQNCSSLLRISKTGHRKDALRCSCGTHNYNLNKGN